MQSFKQIQTWLNSVKQKNENSNVTTKVNTKTILENTISSESINILSDQWKY